LKPATAVRRNWSSSSSTADPEKTGQEGTWRKKRLAEAAETIKARLPALEEADAYVAALTTPAPTETEKGLM
jgi:adenine-specific DNA-methyltransferase